MRSTAGLDGDGRDRAALEIILECDDLAALDAEFPPPLHAQPLEML